MASDDASLKDLSVVPGDLVPVFNSETREYQDRVAHDTSSVLVTATPNDVMAEVEITSDSDNAVVDGQVDLETGQSRIEVLVTAEDGVTQQTYVVTVTRTAETESSTRLNTVILSELSSAMTQSTIEAISDRMDHVQQGSVEGQSNLANRTSFLEALKSSEESLNREDFSLVQALHNVSFVYSPDGEESSAEYLSASEEGTGLGASDDLSIWGTTDYQKLTGGETTPVDWSGDLFSTHFGFDVQPSYGSLYGVAISWSKGSADYTGKEQTGSSRGSYNLRMTGLHPYAAWTIDEESSVWAVAGYRKGNLEVTEDSISQQKLSSVKTMLAGGGRYQLYSADSVRDSDFTLDLKGELWGSRLSVGSSNDGISGASANTQGTRIALEGIFSKDLSSDATLAPSFEVGLRWDGGDGESGTGIELGGGLNYDNHKSGISIRTIARMLANHDSGKKDWGAGFAVERVPGTNELGLSYKINLTHGDTSSRASSLWESGVADLGLSDGSLTTSTELEVGYGISKVHGVVSIPFAGVRWSSSDVTYRLGRRLVYATGLEFKTELERNESDDSIPNHKIMFAIETDW